MYPTRRDLWRTVWQRTTWRQVPWVWLVMANSFALAIALAAVTWPRWLMATTWLTVNVVVLAVVVVDVATWRLARLQRHDRRWRYKIVRYEAGNPASLDNNPQEGSSGN